eukprot:TRINITY_DN2545_c0_g1_i1.p1 TRINITY_DN2545_c0_g1~~TRINITY_DN2545_c0_g1_i1.p1  ORF type:complete len:552 (-),score=163.66 TRINITY_DN2545_c0_g1_i1:395-2050(-)
MMLPVHESGKVTGSVHYFIGVQKDITSIKYGTDPKLWSPPEVADWVERIGLSEYSRAFVLHDITGGHLFSAMDFPWIHPRDKTKLTTEISKLKENFLEYFDDEKRKLSKCDISFRRNGDFPTVEQILAKQILRKKQIRVPVASGNKSFFSSTELYSVSSLIPKLGEIDKIFIAKGNNIMTTFKSPSVMGIFNIITESWRTIPTKVCSGNYPYFAGIVKDKESKDSSDSTVVIYNASTYVFHHIKLWDDVVVADMKEDQKEKHVKSTIKCLFVGKKSIIASTSSKVIIQIKFSDLKVKILEMDDSIDLVNPTQSLSRMTSKKVLLANKTEFQLFEISSGKAKLISQHKVSNDKLLNYDVRGKIVSASSKNHLYIWNSGKEYKINHKYVSAIQVIKKSVIVGDVMGQVTNYVLPSSTSDDDDQPQPRVLNKVLILLDDEVDFSHGVFSLWVSPNNWVFAGNHSSIKIWDIDASAPARKPIAQLKTQGRVQQIQCEKNQLSCLIASEENSTTKYEVLKWSLESNTSKKASLPTGKSVTLDSEESTSTQQECIIL